MAWPRPPNRSFRERRAFLDGEARTWLKTSLRFLPDPVLRPDPSARRLPEMRHRAAAGATKARAEWAATSPRKSAASRSRCRSRRSRRWKSRASRTSRKKTSWKTADDLEDDADAISTDIEVDTDVETGTVARPRARGGPASSTNAVARGRGTMEICLARNREGGISTT